MEKFVESDFIRKSVNVSLVMMVSGFGIALISLSVSIFVHFSHGAVGFFFLLCASLVFGGGLFGAIVSGLSKKDEYTSKFIKYMRNRLNEAYTKKELYSILGEFEELAVENGMYCLSYPVDLKRIHQEIRTKIDFLMELKRRENQNK